MQVKELDRTHQLAYSLIILFYHLISSNLNLSAHLDRRSSFALLGLPMIHRREICCIPSVCYTLYGIQGIFMSPIKGALLRISAEMAFKFSEIPGLSEPKVQRAFKAFEIGVELLKSDQFVAQPPKRQLIDKILNFKL